MQIEQATHGMVEDLDLFNQLPAHPAFIPVEDLGAEAHVYNPEAERTRIMLAIGATTMRFRPGRDNTGVQQELNALRYDLTFVNTIDPNFDHPKMGIGRNAALSDVNFTATYQRLERPLPVFREPVAEVAPVAGIPTLKSNVNIARTIAGLEGNPNNR